MMKRKCIFPFLVTLGILLVSCSAQKKTASAAERSKVDAWGNSKSFELDARWATPLMTRSMNAIAAAGFIQPGSSPGRIDIIGTASYLKVKNDSVMAHLPYYGERQFGGVYNADEAGIQFEGVAEDFTMEYNEKKQHYNFEFDVVNEFGEAFNINGIVYPNLKTRFFINSNERLTIGYSGIVASLED